MKARMIITGITQFRAAMKAHADKVGNDVHKAVVAGGHIVRGAAIKSIQKRSSGEVVTRYRAGGGKYQHVTSAPGSPPNTDTGRLVGSVQVWPGNAAKEVSVGSKIKYAGMLEYGTSKMDARPWLIPALESNRREIERMVKTASQKKATL